VDSENLPVQITIRTILQYNDQFIFSFRIKSLIQSHNILMIQFLQHFHLRFSYRKRLIMKIQLFFRREKLPRRHRFHQENKAHSPHPQLAHFPILLRILLNTLAILLDEFLVFFLFCCQLVLHNTLRSHHRFQIRSRIDTYMEHRFDQILQFDGV